MAIVGSARKRKSGACLVVTLCRGGYLRKSALEVVVLVPRHSQLATAESDPVQDAI